MSDKCQFCGADEILDPHENHRRHDDNNKRYLCWSYFKRDGSVVRSDTCYEAELSALKERLGRAKELLRKYQEFINNGPKGCQCEKCTLYDETEVFLNPPAL